MAMIDIRSEKTPGPAKYVTPALAILSALAVFAVLQILAYQAAGAFDYPLDDPYIHLAIAETIAQGGYGVNADELSSPGSSALFPLLLLPFSGSDFHRFMPLIWNTIGMTLAAGLFGTLLAEAGYCRKSWRALGVGAAVLGPIALMMPMVAYVGMEHSLHAAAVLAVLLGLHRHLAGNGGLILIVLGAFFGAALRLEGVALGVLAAGALFLTGRKLAGVSTAVATILPVALFMAYLTSLGLDPLPSSVQTKLANGEAGALNPLLERSVVLAANLTTLPGKWIGLLVLATLVLWRGAPSIKSSSWAVFAALLFLAGLAHLFFGQIGWLNRYEHYVLVLLGTGVLVLIPHALPNCAPNGAAMSGVSAVLIGGFIAYNIPRLFSALPPASRAIHVQQGQMAKFAKTYLKTDVAVNDLGWVAFQNDNYVLDLWGLASAEAREIRLNDPAPGWTQTLTDKHNVPVAMVYDDWFKDGIGPDWVRMGELRLITPGGFLGGYNVAFYATRPEHVDRLQSALMPWIPTLSEHTRWVWDERMAP